MGYTNCCHTAINYKALVCDFLVFGCLGNFLCPIVKISTDSLLLLNIKLLCFPFSGNYLPTKLGIGNRLMTVSYKYRTPKNCLEKL